MIGNGYFGSLMRMTGIGAPANRNPLQGDVSPVPIHMEETRFAESNTPTVTSKPSEDRGQEPEDGRQMTEDRGQKPEDGGQRVEDEIHTVDRHQSSVILEKETDKIISESVDSGHRAAESETTPSQPEQSPQYLYKSYRTYSPDSPESVQEKEKKGTVREIAREIREIQEFQPPQLPGSPRSTNRSNRTHISYSPDSPEIEPDSPSTKPTPPLPHSPTQPEAQSNQIKLNDVRQWVAGEPETIVDLETDQTIDKSVAVPGEVILKEDAGPQLPWQPSGKKEETREFTLSIGSINLTVEGLQSTAPAPGSGSNSLFQTVPPQSPVQSPGKGASGIEGSSSRLKRHYIRMR